MSTNASTPTSSVPLAARPARLLSADEVGELLGVPRTLVYALARRRELPCVHVGERYVRFRPEALESWIEKQEARGDWR
jgi:excisionase family DNA binding protein